MKIFRSIKWRLQMWYGLILLAVLAGFGITAYQLEYGRQMRQVDDELHRRFAAVTGALHQPGRNRPPPERLTEGFPPPGEEMPGEKLNLAGRLAGLFGTNQPEHFYFVISSRDGRELARGGDVPTYDVVAFNGHHSVNLAPALQDVRPDLFAKPSAVFWDGKFSELSSKTPFGEMIRVGCSIAPELKELHRTAWQLSVAGGIILFLGLAGGGWLVSRAIKPIEDISAAAVKISAGDLSRRINVAETESELGKLAAVLNSTFARLESAFAQQKQFASDAAHELRTPVTVILTQTQTALNRQRDTGEYKQTVEACQRAAQRMKKLISALLQLARLDAGQEKIMHLPFDFSKTVADCVEMIHPVAADRDIKIFSELSPLEISGDPELLAQVVTNLLANAIQYNRAGGEVRVKLKAENGFASMKISDTGQGIAPEDLPHIFKRFYRGDKSRTGAANSGLGLAICEAIVEAHGGTIEAASTEDIGTTFTVQLPLP